MKEKEKLEKIAIKMFKQHWAKILNNLEKDNINYIDKYFDRFEADTKARKKILAGRFYSIDHAKKMTSLSSQEIKNNLSCYLPRAIEYALSEPLFLTDKSEAFLRKLLCGQYVMYSWYETEDGSCFFEQYSEDSFDNMSLIIESYPTSWIEDNDWYGKTLFRGFYAYYILILMKSTGEAFSNTEMMWLKKSIQRNIDSQDEDDTLWWFKCYPINKNKLWIKVYVFPNTKDYIIDGFLREDWKQHFYKHQLREFTRRMIEYLYKEKRWIKKLIVFNNYKSMNKKELYDVLITFFDRHSNVLNNSEIKAIEDIMNDIISRKNRDYHAEVGWF